MSARRFDILLFCHSSFFSVIFEKNFVYFTKEIVDEIKIITIEYFWIDLIEIKMIKNEEFFSSFQKKQKNEKEKKREKRW